MCLLTGLGIIVGMAACGTDCWRTFQPLKYSVHDPLSHVLLACCNSSSYQQLQIIQAQAHMHLGPFPQALPQVSHKLSGHIFQRKVVKPGEVASALQQTDKTAQLAPA